MDLALDESIFNVKTTYYSGKFVKFSWTDGDVAQDSTSSVENLTVWKSGGDGAVAKSVFFRARKGREGGWCLLEWVDCRLIILRISRAVKIL